MNFPLNSEIFSSLITTLLKFVIFELQEKRVIEI